MARHFPDLNLLVALQVLLEENSVSKAAERLGITQPAMTHTLNKLRLLFQDPLLYRKANQMHPTELASSLGVPLDEMMRIVDEILHHSESFDPANCDLEFRLFMEDAGQSVLAIELYSRLSKIAPKATIRLKREACVEDFQRGEVDMMLWHRRYESPFYHLPLCECRFVTIARKGHPRLKSRQMSLLEFTTLPQVAMDCSGNFGVDIDEEIDRRLETLGCIRKKAASISSLIAVKRLVSASDLIATVPDVLLTDYEPHIELQTFEPPIELKPTPIFLIWHQRTNSHPAHKWFRDFLAQLYMDNNHAKPLPRPGEQSA